MKGKLFGSVSEPPSTAKPACRESSYHKIPRDFLEKYNIPKYPSLRVSKLVNKFSDSTLFFIFYYQQGSYNQVLAEEELIRRK